MKKLIIFFSFIILLNCSAEKHKKIEISGEKKDIKTEIIPSDINSSKNLSADKFFKISIEINKITRDYNSKLHNLPDKKINLLLKKLDNDIKNIYLKFNTSESEFNNYSLYHYKELDEYLKKHPKVDEAMRQ